MNMGSSYMDFKSFGEVDGNGGRVQGNSFPLARQPSMYSLTFDELQTNFSGFGKDFGSMNMDELLRTIWTAEETQTQVPTASAAVGCGEPIAGVGGLHKQGSLTLPRTLSQKTVDQVWKDLNEESRLADFQPKQTTTLAEMTLEDFLLKAGVVREDAQQGAVSSNNGGFYGVPASNSSGMNIGFQPSASGLNNKVTVDKLSVNGFNAVNPSNGIPLSMAANRPSKTLNLHPLFPKPANVTFSSPMRPTNRPQLPNIAPKSIMIGMADSNGFRSQNGGMGIVSLRNGTVKVPIEPPMKKVALDVSERNSSESSPLAPSPYGYSPVMSGRRGGAGVERVVERRHRRMIKNRESAARSRARKQAYTLELEAEIAKLRDLNEELHRKQDEIIEIQKDEMIEKMRLQWGSKRVCLRRTLTGPW
ncbi:unnamed protein product [Rhodiola kirilowii]